MGIAFQNKVFYANASSWADLSVRNADTRHAGSIVGGERRRNAMLASLPATVETRLATQSPAVDSRHVGAHMMTPVAP
jgi:hypothetical protein